MTTIKPDTQRADEYATVTVDYPDGTMAYINVPLSIIDRLEAVIESMTGRRMSIQT